MAGIMKGHTIAMTDVIRSLLQLQTWLSPAFPTGSFAYSHGLEAAIAAQLVTDRETTLNWLKALLQEGSGWNDALVLSESWKAARVSDIKALHKINDLALALQPARERWLETTLQGKAFVDAASIWKNPLSAIFENTDTALPVAVGALTATSAIDRKISIATYLNAFFSSLIWVCVRLVPLGQSDGLAIIAKLEKEIVSQTENVAASTLDNLGSCALVSDIASIAHEHMTTRIFRS